MGRSGPTRFAAGAPNMFIISHPDEARVDNTPFNDYMRRQQLQGTSRGIKASPRRPSTASTAREPAPYSPSPRRTLQVGGPSRTHGANFGTGISYDMKKSSHQLQQVGRLDSPVPEHNPWTTHMPKHMPPPHQRPSGGAPASPGRRPRGSKGSGSGAKLAVHGAAAGGGSQGGHGGGPAVTFRDQRASRARSIAGGSQTERHASGTQAESTKGEVVNVRTRNDFAEPPIKPSFQPLKNPFPEAPVSLARDAWASRGLTTETRPRDLKGEFVSTMDMYGLARARSKAVMDEMRPQHVEWIRRKMEPAYPAYHRDREQRRRDKFNEVVAALKGRIDQKGAYAITASFNALDKNKSGVLERNEFRKAIKAMYPVDNRVADELMATVDVDDNGAVNYHEFCNGLRFGRVNYKPSQNPNLRLRAGPNPDLPLNADDNMAGPRPWAVMSDATRALEEFDRNINSRFGNIKDTFEKFDADHSGEVDKEEFNAAMRSIPGLNLSDREITELFKGADRDYSGSISYEEFILSFSGGGGKRFLPEFLKPRSLRRSQPGHPWSWDMKARSGRPQNC